MKKFLCIALFFTACKKEIIRETKVEYAPPVYFVIAGKQNIDSVRAGREYIILHNVIRHK